MPNFNPYQYQVQPIPLPSTVRELDILTQRPSRQSPGGFPILDRGPRMTIEQGFPPGYYSPGGGGQIDPGYNIVFPRPGAPGPNFPGSSIGFPRPGAPGPNFPGSSLDPINQPLPTSPIPGLEPMPGYDPDLIGRISGLLDPGAISPLHQRAIDILTGIGTNAAAESEARARSRALALGRSGSSLETQDIGRAISGEVAKTQAAVAPILQQGAEFSQRSREALAGFLGDVGKMDVQNRRDAIIRYTDRLVQTGQFDINNLVKLRTSMAELIQREIEDLRQKGLDDERLKTEKELRLKELDQRMDELRLKAEQARQQSILDFQLNKAQPVIGSTVTTSPFGGGSVTVGPTGQYRYPVLVPSVGGGFSYNPVR